MPTEISSLLQDLYDSDSHVGSLEKTAEDQLLATLRGEDQVSENPLETMDDDALLKLAHELGLGQEEEVLGDEDLEKVAADMLGGQVMAHAMIHEFGLIKTAMIEGKCRVCKENPRDIPGASICTSCAADD